MQIVITYDWCVRAVLSSPVVDMGIVFPYCTQRNSGEAGELVTIQQANEGLRNTPEVSVPSVPKGRSGSGPLMECIVQLRGIFSGLVDDLRRRRGAMASSFGVGHGMFSPDGLANACRG